MRGAKRRGNPRPPLSLRGAKRRGNPHPPLSLRGAKRRGNPYFRQCKTKAGLLRLRLAMTVGRLAMTRILVIARSEATWQSTPPPSLRGAKRRGNPYSRHCKTKDRLLRLRLAMTVGMARNDSNLCHCEECSDVAINPNPVIARSKATWQSIFQVVQDDRWIASPSARNDSGDGSQ